MAATIGTSVLEFIEGIDGEPNLEEPSDDTPINGIESILGTVLSASDGNSKRILLKGPTKSGKTSLAMNLAYSLAARAKCVRNCRLSRACCSCVAVSILTTSGEGTSFPVYCEQKVDNLDVRAKLQALDNVDSTWNERVLHRIRINHISTPQQLLQYLLGIQSLPEGERPQKGIIIDDVDKLELKGDDTTPRSTDSHRAIVQRVALLADTADALLKFGAVNFHVLATLQSGLPTNVERMLSNWLPHVLTIEENSTRDATNQSWRIETNSGTTQHYHVHKKNGETRIEWGPA